MTISDEIAREIRVRTAEQSSQMGTLVDQTIRDHRPVPAALDRMYTNDIFKAIQPLSSSDREALLDAVEQVCEANKVQLGEYISVLRVMQYALTWQQKGMVPQPFKWSLHQVLAQSGWVPTAIKLGFLVGDEWFRRGVMGL